MKKLFIFAFFILFIASYCFYLNRYSFIVVGEKLRLDAEIKYYDYRGITHAHSNISTGSGSPLEIIEIAKEQKLDFLFLTEVNDFIRDSTLESYYGPLLVLEGGEYSYLDSRILYYDRPANQPPTSQGQAQVYFTDLLSQYPRNNSTGMIVLAHPLHSRHTWSGEFPKGLDGIEVINLKRVLEIAWKEKKVDSIWSIMTYLLNPHLSLLRVYRDPEQEVALWDTLSKSRHVVGLTGTDATAKAILTPSYSLKFPSYGTAFSVASNHLLLRSELTGDFESDRAKIMTALREGNVYLALDILGSPKGFWAELRDRSKAHLIGSEVNFREGMDIAVHLPSEPAVPYEIRLIKDGEILATVNAPEMEIPIHSPGVYRIVVRILAPMPFPEGNKWVPWIYTNPFFVR